MKDKWDLKIASYCGQIELETDHSKAKDYRCFTSRSILSQSSFSLKFKRTLPYIIEKMTSNKNKVISIFLRGIV